MSMSVRINHNVTALNAYRQLSNTTRALAKSLEKLSSGYRINRAADDPAGLIISEKLRAQITGLDTALRNTQDAVSMVQTAEGALNEMHSLLNSMRALALHAANEGANDSDQVSADQEQIDSAIESLNRIAETTRYAGKYLLNGNAGDVVATIVDTTNIASVTLGTDSDGNSTIPDSAISSGYLTYKITQAATKAKITGNIQYTGGSSMTIGSAGGFDGDLAAGTLVINGVTVLSAGMTGVSGGMTIGSAIAIINSALDSDARTANLTAYLDSSGYLVIEETRYGSRYGIDISDTTSGTSDVGIMFSAKIYNTAAAGQDISGWIGTSSILSNCYGDGLTLYVSGTTGSNYNGTRITFNSAGNVVSTTAVSDDIQLSSGQLVFQLGAFVTSDEQVTQSIGDMRPSALGLGGTRTVSAIQSGGAYDLDSDPSTAIQIIDAAIDQVSLQRARLGAFQKNTLESNLNSLSIARENLIDSESRIRDVDMASEMMEFTRAQILMQAGVAMLAQANLVPQAILQLLG